MNVQTTWYGLDVRVLSVKVRGFLAHELGEDYEDDIDYESEAMVLIDIPISGPVQEDHPPWQPGKQEWVPMSEIEGPIVYNYGEQRLDGWFHGRVAIPRKNDPTPAWKYL